MKILSVGETVKLSHGGSLTQIKGFWSIDNMIKFRDTECKYANFCREYARKKWWGGFTCIYCSKINRVMEAQKVNFDFHRVKVSDNQYIPIGYKKIHKPVKAQNIDSIKLNKKLKTQNKKPAVKNFELPKGANPINSSGPRDALCKYYDDCMKYVLQEERYSFYFSCVDCKHASKSIRASKPAKAEITEKPTVKNFELPEGANPIYVSVYEPVYISCKFYKQCVKHIRHKHKDWLYFSCINCKVDKSIKSQGSNPNIRCVVPKRTNAKTLKGKRQSQETPMGYKVI